MASHEKALRLDRFSLLEVCMCSLRFAAVCLWKPRGMLSFGTDSEDGSRFVERISH